MKKNTFLLPLKNLQFFGEEPESSEDLDFDAMQAAFEEEWTEEDDVVEEEVEEVETEESDNEDQTEPENDETEVETEATEEDKQSKADKAFAEMRRKNEELSKYEKLIRNIADKNGITPEEVLQQYEEKQLHEQAEQQNVPVDVLKRLNSLESENKAMREKQFADSFNSQVEDVKSKYGIDEQAVGEVIKFYHDNKLPVDVPFETAYKMANLDTIIEKTVNDTRQKELSEKKKRQQSTAIPAGDSAAPVDDDASLEKEVQAYLKEEGFI